MVDALLSRLKHFAVRRKETVHKVPGTVEPEAGSPPPDIRVIGYGRDEFEDRKALNVDGLRQIVERHRVTWIDVEGFGDGSVVQQIGRQFNLHPLALEDVVNLHQRPKVEEYGDCLFIVAQMTSSDPDVPPEQVSLFVGKNFVITFQAGADGDCFDDVRQRIRNSRGRIRAAGPDYLAYALLDAMVDAYFPVLERLGDRLDEVEVQIDDGAGTVAVAAIHVIRSDLLVVRRAVWPLRDALNLLVRDPNPLIAADTKAYLRDCYDHTVQIIDLAEVYRELCSDLRDYVLTTLSQRTNEIMKILTLIATIFIPLGFIAGLYGMNFDTSVSPWNMPELKWALGYPFALSLMAAIALSFLWFFWRKGWIP